MYVLATNMWFSSLMRQFFFWIDKIVFNFISSIYDVLIAIARTSVFTQSDFAEMTDRIYKLLAVFMVFKVTLSLITYVVNPDNFTEKSKGVYKLSTNIIISLAMLILTPYIFSYAYQVQTILLEDNSLGVLIFGGENDNSAESVFNTAGDKIAYTAMTPFFTPNLSLVSSCSNLLGQTDEDGNGKIDFNYACSGWSEGKTNEDGTLYGLIKDNEKNFSEQTLRTYVAGVEYGNLGLMFRQDMALATANDNTEFVMDYKFIFSTATGIIIILLLITFCMDVGVRSIKLAFFQLIAPVPIISYIDPKKGKDGMFKKWAEMCFKTYLSLFVRLVALYFAVFIINKVADRQLVDIVDGSYVNNAIIYVFIIIGALMFAKQLPEILKGLGIKLDGDGKFTLNPLKKLNENTIGGKRLTGAAGGMVAGMIGGRGIAGRLSGMASGAARGFMANKGYSGGLSKQADVNRKLREARIGGAGFWGSRAAVLSSRYGLDDADLEREATKLRKDKRAVELSRRAVDTQVKAQEVIKKGIENAIKPKQDVIAKQNAVKSKIDALEKYSSSLIEGGKAGEYSKKYRMLKSTYDNISTKVGEKSVEDIFNDEGKLILKAGDTITQDVVQQAEGSIGRYLKKTGVKAVMDELFQGKHSGENGEGGQVALNDLKSFKAQEESYQMDVNVLKDLLKEYNKNAKQEDQIEAEKIYNTYDDIHGQKGDIETTVTKEETTIQKQKASIEACDREIKRIQTTTSVDISGKSDEVTIEEAERILKEREQKLKDKQDQRKLQRGYAKDSRIGGGS